VFLIEPTRVCPPSGFLRDVPAGLASPREIMYL
jgi:hypothetical protein